ncbi:MAG: ATP-binding cassette domain-containing protein [Bifidobacteriaceae bacterium]|jgi:ABC-type lipoprotein export system ATPase subunit|nr:ATP-binding cassette domain-containing protein [Bifidobacteriaceae bacterium]
MSLRAVGLSFAYPHGELLLKDLDLAVPWGTSAAIMAPSGIGKSTLLAVLGGLRRPSSGFVEISPDGGPAHASPETVRPAVAWVFQSMQLLLGRTVLDNVALVGMPRGFDRARAEGLAYVELRRFGVDALAHRLVRSLSGGQRQRVALARAAMADPLVVLADEPTANLDRASALGVAEVLIGQFSRASVVVATHDPAVARLASVAYLLRDGRVETAEL